MAQASSTVLVSARALANTNIATYRLWTTLMALGAAIALTVALAVAQSISRPLRRLADTARLVVGGHLEGERLVPTGPTETVVVADAFNALMANLRLLESKAQALAACDFDNEVLAVPLPGQLGASLQDSVRVLAGSIQDRHQLQERLGYEATHDTLTDLINRAAAITSLEQALAQAGGTVTLRLSCTSTWTTSSRPTTCTATRRATISCARSRCACRARCGRATWWAVSAATSSW